MDDPVICARKSVSFKDTSSLKRCVDDESSWLSSLLSEIVFLLGFCAIWLLILVGAEGFGFGQDQPTVR